MKSVTRVFLFGSLKKRLGDLHDLPLQLELEAPIKLDEVLKRLKIPADGVKLAMVNYRSVPRDSSINPGDRLSLFPIEYPIFADWIDHRF